MQSLPCAGFFLSILLMTDVPAIEIRHSWASFFSAMPREKATGGHMKINFLLKFIWLLASTHLAALPSLTNNCGEKGINIRMPDGTSDIIAFDKECQTAYVGPPSTGSAEVVSVFSSANLSFCPSIKALPMVINKLMVSYDYWLDELNKATNDALSLKKEYDAQEKKLIEREEEQHAIEEQLAKREEEYQSVMRDIRDLSARFNECLVLNVQDCEGIAQEFSLLKKKYVEFRGRYIVPLEDQLSDSTRAAKTLARTLKQINDDIAKNADIFQAHRQRLRSLRNEVIEDYALFGALEGMTAQILFESRWKEQLEEVKRSNPSAQVHIAPLPISKSKIFVDLANSQKRDINFPATLIYASVPGFTQSGTTVEVLPSGDVQVKDLTASVDESSAFMSGATGKIILSLVGSCPLTNGNNNLNRNLNFDELSSLISVNTFNEYPMLHERRHKVTFNASRFAEEIEKRTEEGGFFHTSSVHDIVRSNFSDDDFKVEFDHEPGAREYSEEEKAILTQEAKKEVLDRVLREIGVVHQLSAQKPPMPAELKQSGAGKIYAETECFGWTYCYVATFVIGVLDSIFGTKDAVTKFIAQNNQRVTHVYSERKPAGYTFTTTFSRATHQGER